jgi:hypothetical protein
MDACNPFPQYLYTCPQQGPDYTSVQPTMRPIANHLLRDQFPHTSRVSTASSISCTNRVSHNSYGYPYRQDNDGYTPTSSAKESESHWDKYNGPGLSPSTDFTGQTWGSSFQEDGELFGDLSLEDDPLASAAGVSDSLNRTLLRPTPQKVPDLSTDMLSLSTSPTFSQHDGSYQELNTATVQPYQQDDQTDAGVFQFALEDQETTPKPNTTSMPTNPHSVGTHGNILMGQTYGGPATIQPIIGSASTPKIVQRSALGSKRRRLTEERDQEDERNYPQNSLPTPSANGHIYGLQADAATIVHSWQSLNPNRPPNKAELDALSLLTRASRAAILRVFMSNDLSVINTLPANTNPLPARPDDQADPDTTCATKKRSFLPWNKRRDPKKMYSCTKKCGWTFARKADWIRHEQINAPQTWSCPRHGCRRSFNRKDKLREHIKTVHKVNPKTYNLRPTDAYPTGQFLRLCGFCGHPCAPWSTWTEHVGKHFEDQIPGGPWEMSRWRDPWVDDQAGQSTGGNDGGDDNSNYQDSDYDASEDAPHDSTDDSGPGIGGPPDSTGGSGSSRSHSNRGASSRSDGGGRSGSYDQAGQQFSALFGVMKTAEIVPCIGSVPRATRTQQNGRHNETEDHGTGTSVNVSTWPLTKDQSVSEPSVGSVLGIERTDPLADLACTGKSQRSAHNAELVPYLEEKAQLIARSQSASGSQDDSETENHTSSRVCQPASQSPHHLTEGSIHNLGPWSRKENGILRALVKAYGPNNWVRISKSMQGRSSTQCQERYYQDLKPSLKVDLIAPPRWSRNMSEKFKEILHNPRRCEALDVTDQSPVVDIGPLHVYQRRHEAAEPSNLISAFLWRSTYSDPKSDPKVGEPVSVRGLAAAELQTSSSIDELKVAVDSQINGKFIAVMGGPGSGKFTLVGVASGLDAVDVGRDCLSYIILIGAPGVNDTPHPLTLVDMSALNHTPLTEMEMLDDIAANWLDSTSRNISHSKRRGIICNLTSFRDHCGGYWFENVVLATTCLGTTEKASDLSKAVSNGNQLVPSFRDIGNFLKHYQHQEYAFQINISRKKLSR